MSEVSFSVCWGVSVPWGAARGIVENRATEHHRPFATNEEARAARDAYVAKLASQGIKTKRSTLRHQLRQWWSLGVPCGLWCHVYMVKVL